MKVLLTQDFNNYEEEIFKKGSIFEVEERDGDFFIFKHYKNKKYPSLIHAKYCFLTDNILSQTGFKIVDETEEQKEEQTEENLREELKENIDDLELSFLNLFDFIFKKEQLTEIEKLQREGEKYLDGIIDLIHSLDLDDLKTELEEYENIDLSFIDSFEKATVLFIISQLKIAIKLKELGE